MDGGPECFEDGTVEVLRLDTERKGRLIAAVANAVIAHAEELTALDSAIGDGDHGHNMKRGFEAVLRNLEALAPMALPDLLKAIGTRLVMTIGGASGPLYGTLFVALGKARPAEPSQAEAATAFAAAIAAVKARGRSDIGQKTMLDVLAPVRDALTLGSSASAVTAVAAKAANATAPVKAIRGRASFLGERSIGHVDPGARSSQLMIAALCEEFGAA
jgi:phosphoenolpyruvate---glycerone phosphotransferase subunit DhaL